MSSERRKGENEQETAAPSVADSCFWPRPVDPEEARRGNPTPAVVDRSVVELTSPIGHRLRVRPNTAGGTAPNTAGGTAAAPGSESILSADALPTPKKKKRR